MHQSDPLLFDIMRLQYSILNFIFSVNTGLGVFVQTDNYETSSSITQNPSIRRRPEPSSRQVPVENIFV